MKKEEAISVLKVLASFQGVMEYLEQHSVSVQDACNMAIQALSQEPCDAAIDREELLKAIDTWDKFGYTETGCFVREPKGDYVPYIHYDDVIKCIKGMPPVTQKSIECDDAISRDAAIEAVKQAIYNHDSAIMRLTELPSVTQKSGKWIPLENRIEWGERVKCSECGQVFITGDDISRHYCPNCGAKMESEG